MRGQRFWRFRLKLVRDLCGSFSLNVLRASLALTVMIVANFYGCPLATAETTDQDILTMTNAFKSELQKAIEQNHTNDTVSQENAYESIVIKYINTQIALPDAVKILRGAGFSITVSGDGFFEAYPASGPPSRGTMVSGGLYYKAGFLSGGALGVNMFLYPGNYTAIKDVKIAVNTISP